MNIKAAIFQNDNTVAMTIIDQRIPIGFVKEETETTLKVQSVNSLQLTPDVLFIRGREITDNVHFAQCEFSTKDKATRYYKKLKNTLIELNNMNMEKITQPAFYREEIIG